MIIFIFLLVVVISVNLFQSISASHLEALVSVWTEPSKSTKNAVSFLFCVRLNCFFWETWHINSHQLEVCSLKSFLCLQLECCWLYSTLCSIHVSDAVFCAWCSCQCWLIHHYIFVLDGMCFKCIFWIISFKWQKWFHCYATIKALWFRHCLIVYMFFLFSILFAEICFYH